MGSLTLLASASASPLKVTSSKAASPYVNIGCQCSPLTFQDQYGAIQGNCRAADSTGARWCYIDNALTSSCQDKRFSARFPNNPWSYEACATPPPPPPPPPSPPCLPLTCTRLPARPSPRPSSQSTPILSSLCTSTDTGPTSGHSNLWVNSSPRRLTRELLHRTPSSFEYLIKRQFFRNKQ